MPVTKGQGNPDWTREETVLVLDLVMRTYPKIPGKTSVEVVALSELIRSLPVHQQAQRNSRFRNPSGVYMKMMNLASCFPDRKGTGLRNSRMDRDVVAEFFGKADDLHLLAEAIRAGIAALAATSPDESDEPGDYEAPEGATLLRLHRFRERSRGLRAKVLARVKARHGHLVCAACGTSCVAAGGPLEPSIFECHHLLPLSQSEARVTRVPDLSLLCANCHRLIHALMVERKAHVQVDDFKSWLTSLHSLKT